MTENKKFLLTHPPTLPRLFVNDVEIPIVLDENGEFEYTFNESSGENCYISEYPDSYIDSIHNNTDTSDLIVSPKTVYDTYYINITGKKIEANIIKYANKKWILINNDVEIAKINSKTIHTYKSDYLDINTQYNLIKGLKQKYDISNALIISNVTDFDAYTIVKYPNEVTEVWDQITKYGIAHYSYDRANRNNISTIHVNLTYPQFSVWIWSNQWDNPVEYMQTIFSQQAAILGSVYLNYKGIFKFADGVTKTFNEIIAEHTNQYSSKLIGERSNNYIEYYIAPSETYGENYYGTNVIATEFVTENEVYLKYLSNWIGDEGQVKEYSLAGNSAMVSRKYFKNSEDISEYWHCGILFNAAIIILPETVTSLINPFADTVKIPYYGVKAMTPPKIESEIFNDVSLQAILVPASSVETYKTAENWSKYADKIIGYDFDA